MTKVETKRLKELLPLFSPKGMRESSNYQASADYLRIAPSWDGDEPVLSLRRVGLEIQIEAIDKTEMDWAPRDVDDLAKAIKVMGSQDAVRIVGDRMEELGVRSGIGSRVGIKNQSVELNDTRIIERSPVDPDRLMMLFDRDSLSEAITKAWPFPIQDATRPALNAMRFGVPNKKNDLVEIDATDSFRFLRQWIPVEPLAGDSPHAEMVVSRGDLHVLRNLLKKSSGTIFCYDTTLETNNEKPSARTVAFQSCNTYFSWTLHCKLVGQEYPRVDAILPDKDTMIVARTERNRLLEAAKIANEVVAIKNNVASHMVVLAFDVTDTLTIDSESERGSYSQKLWGTLDDEEVHEVRVGLDSKYLIEALSAGDQKQVRIMFDREEVIKKDSSSRADNSILKPIYIDDVLQMPMRLPVEGGKKCQESN